MKKEYVFLVGALVWLTKVLVTVITEQCADELRPLLPFWSQPC